MRTSVVCFLVLELMAGDYLVAQSRGAGKSGARALLPRDQEIALARSAGPATVTAGARVYVLTATGYVVADSGTGAACYVSRSWPQSLEPHCFDSEGAVTILPMEMRRVELLTAGRPMDEVEREIADGIIAGKYRLPTRPAASYMMPCAQQLISDEGQAVGKWRSHLMIYFPYLTNESIGMATGPDLKAAVVVNPGGEGPAKRELPPAMLRDSSFSCLRTRPSREPAWWATIPW